MLSFPTTFLSLVAEKYDETVAEPSSNCFCTAIGALQIDLHRLVTELSRGPAQQDSEILLELLVALAVTCAATAEDLVLPELKGEVD